jgi:hypothetical protein
MRVYIKQRQLRDELLRPYEQARQVSLVQRGRVRRCWMVRLHTCGGYEEFLYHGPSERGPWETFASVTCFLWDHFRDGPHVELKHSTPYDLFWHRNRSGMALFYVADPIFPDDFNAFVERAAVRCFVARELWQRRRAGWSE